MNADPCRRWSAYLKVQGKTWGIEAEWNKATRTLRAVSPRGTRVWTTLMARQARAAV